MAKEVIFNLFVAKKGIAEISLITREGFAFFKKSISLHAILGISSIHFSIFGLDLVTSIDIPSSLIVGPTSVIPD